MSDALWIGEGAAPVGAVSVVGGDISTPFQRRYERGDEATAREELAAHEAVLSRFKVAKLDLYAIPRLMWMRERLDPMPRDAKIADIGCGPAFTSYALTNGRTFIGVDVDGENIAFARAALSGVAVDLRQSDGNSLPMPDASMDAVLLCEVLEHVPHEAGLLNEVRRVLKPGGRVLVSVPGLRYGFDTFLRLMRVKTVHDFPGPEFHHRMGYTSETLRDLMQRNGFETRELAYLVGPLTRGVQDCVSIAHIAVQRFVHGRRSWNWSQTSALADSPAMRAYAAVHPLLRQLVALDRRLGATHGFQLMGDFRKL